jgi:hypothetical protein
LEAVLSEGLQDRVIDLLAGRLIWRWHLGSGVESNRLYPETFWIPSDEEKARVTEGTLVKLMFHMKDGWGERMWVRIIKIGPKGFVGTLNNDPVGIPRLQYGDEIKFGPDEIIDINLDTALPPHKMIGA